MNNRPVFRAWPRSPATTCVESGPGPGEQPGGRERPKGFFARWLAPRRDFAPTTGQTYLSEFADTFESECAMAGGTVVVSDLFASIESASTPRPKMITAIERIRSEGLRVGALTNNWHADNAQEPRNDKVTKDFLGNLFDVVVESAIEGVRKPDPKIYEITCDRLAVSPTETVFLDDLGTNLKPARAIGMATIKVEDPDKALAELAALLKFSLEEA